MTELTDVQPGDVLERKKNVTRPQLFRYSAITWNAHRIHYDPEYAKEEEEHPDVIVQQHMYGALIQELVLDWLGEDGELTELNWRNVGRTTPENTLMTTAEVADVDQDERTVTFKTVVESEEMTCVEGTATVRLFE